jgi:hypothetical protein
LANESAEVIRGEARRFGRLLKRQHFLSVEKQGTFEFARQCLGCFGRFTGTMLAEEDCAGTPSGREIVYGRHIPTFYDRSSTHFLGAEEDWPALRESDLLWSIGRAFHGSLRPWPAL